MGRFRERHDPIGYPIYLGTSYARLPWESVWQMPTDFYWGDNAGIAATRPSRRSEYCWDDLHPGPPYKSGGPLDLWVKRDYSTIVQGSGTFLSENTCNKYEGGFVCSYGPGSVGIPVDFGLPSSSWNDYGAVSQHGATAWNRFKPGKPTADLGVFLGELKDLPRMLKSTAAAFHGTWKAMGGKRTSFGPKSVANQWLNTQFGWLPFLSDMRKFYNTSKNLENELNQLKRDNGQWIKRGGTVKDDGPEVEPDVQGSETSTAHHPILASGFYANPYSSSGSYRISVEKTQQVWFKARFRYFIPDIGTPKWRRRAIRQLFGGSISPSLLWELTPWSWLVDWFTNIGDVVSNMDNNLAENLAAKYAYLMGTTAWNYSCESSADFVHGPSQCVWTWSITRKTRETASPFGFGLTGGDFSARQWSILSALGLTRLR